MNVLFTPITIVSAEPGTWTITEAPFGIWQPTATTVNAASLTPAATVSVTVATTDVSVTFGNARFVTVSGRVALDSNPANGQVDAAESAFSVIQVTLDAGTPSARSVTTNALGAYSFSSVVVGTHTVQISLPSGYAVSPTGSLSSTISVALSADRTLNFPLMGQFE